MDSVRQQNEYNPRISPQDSQSPVHMHVDRRVMCSESERGGERDVIDTENKTQQMFYAPRALWSSREIEFPEKAFLSFCGLVHVTVVKRAVVYLFTCTNAFHRTGCNSIIFIFFSSFKRWKKDVKTSIKRLHLHQTSSYSFPWCSTSDKSNEASLTPSWWAYTLKMTFLFLIDFLRVY